MTVTAALYSSRNSFVRSSFFSSSADNFSRKGRTIGKLYFMKSFKLICLVTGTKTCDELFLKTRQYSKKSLHIHMFPLLGSKLLINTHFRFCSESLCISRLLFHVILNESHIIERRYYLPAGISLVSRPAAADQPVTSMSTLHLTLYREIRDIRQLQTR